MARTVKHKLGVQYYHLEHVSVEMIQVCSFISLLFSASYLLLYASVVRDVVGQ
jgi:hypothetical protein